MKYLEKCIHQVFRKGQIKEYSLEHKEGYGNCYECTYDPIRNSKCKGYHPIKVYAFEVKEN